MILSNNTIELKFMFSYRVYIMVKNDKANIMIKRNGEKLGNQLYNLKGDLLDNLQRIIKHFMSYDGDKGIVDDFVNDNYKDLKEFTEVYKTHKSKKLSIL